MRVTWKRDAALVDTATKLPRRRSATDSFKDHNCLLEQVDDALKEARTRTQAPPTLSSSSSP